MVMFFLSHIVQYGITARTGFPTSVEEMSSNPLRGSVYIRSFRIRNPDHYRKSDFIDIERLDLKASPASFFRDRLVVERFEVEIPRITGIRNADGQVNLEEFGTVIEEMLNERRDRERGREVVIERLRLKIDTVVLIDYASGNGGVTEDYRVNVDLELTDVTSLRKVAPEVLRQFAAAGISFEDDALLAAIVPEELLSRIRADIGSVDRETREAGP